MKIYFACSIRGEQGGKEEKELMVNTMKDLGHNVLSEQFVNYDVTKNQQNSTEMTSEDIYTQDMGWVNESDIVVADVSRISTGMGYEVGWKLAKGGKVLALCKADKYEGLSNMLKGCNEPNFKLISWQTAEDVAQILEKELGRAEHE